MDFEAYVINLDKSERRMKNFRAAFATVLSSFKRIAGCPGSTLPNTIEVKLKYNFPSAGKGGLGCTLSHVMVWEQIIASEATYGLVMEDDVRPLRDFPTKIANLGLPNDFDICFANERIACWVADQADCRKVVPLSDALRRFPLRYNAPGSDCYILSKTGAEKLLDFFATDGYGSFVDWRMLTYCLSRDELESLDKTGTPRAVFDVLHPISTNHELLKAYVLTSALVRVLGEDSDLMSENDDK